MMNNLDTLKGKMKLFIAIISLFLSLSLTCNAQITLLNDSTVKISLQNYREVRSKLMLADSLISRSQLQIRLLTDKTDQQSLRIEGLQKMNDIHASQNKDLRKQNKELLSQLNESTKKQWFKRPEIYFVSGIILGVIATR